MIVVLRRQVKKKAAIERRAEARKARKINT